MHTKVQLNQYTIFMCFKTVENNSLYQTLHRLEDKVCYTFTRKENQKFENERGLVQAIENIEDEVGI